MVRIPTATYRLQLRRGFGFDDAARLVPWLDLLGITDLYVSQLLTARQESRDGAEVIDHSRLDPELGGAEGFERLARALQKYEMGLLVDVVSGHMSAHAPISGWWTDVLENGRASPFASAFDIDWASPSPGLSNRVLLPILREQYGRVLEAGELRVEHHGGSFWLRYQDHQLPLDPRSWSGLLARAGELIAGDTPHHKELHGVVKGLEALPHRDEHGAERLRERLQKKPVLQARLMALLDRWPALGEAIDEALRQLNGSAGDPRSFDELDTLLSEQPYRVAHWRVASEEINYRRFRDINDLAGLRVEEQRVFDAVHQVHFELVRQGLITGLRIDCVDGLLDPSSYLRAMQEHCRVPGHPPQERAIYLVVDKVLSEGERLPDGWPVHGTTGYDFLNDVTGIFIDQQGAHAMLEHYVRLTHRRQLFSEVAWECKKLALSRCMSSQVAMLGRRLAHLAGQHRASRDFTSQDLTEALIEVLACQRVYRTYLGLDGQLSERDVRRVDDAVCEARRRNPALSGLLFEFVRSVLVLELPPELSEAQREEWRAFVLRLQQASAGVMARALESIAVNRFYPLSSSGEVGAEPEYPAISLSEFHRRNQKRLERHPHSLLATTTHDTKRSEDVRARIRVLSRFPESWAAAFEKFHVMNQRHCEALPEGHAPDVNEEYLFYQTLVGVWPFEPLDKDRRAALSERLCDYMVRVLREAKVHSSSVSPHAPWERAVCHFVESVLLPATSGDFLPAFQSFVEPLMKLGIWTSLAEALIKSTAPGVPDFYQGTELWDLSLMDPDNQRPVDFALRERLLRELLFEAEEDPIALIKRLVAAPADGRLKLFVTQRALVARRSQRVVFERGAYAPVEALGQQADRVVAFARLHEKKTFVVACGRFLSAVKAHERTPIGEPVWGTTRLWLPPGHDSTLFRDAFTGLEWAADGGSLRMCDVFAHLPLALLESVDEA